MDIDKPLDVRSAEYLDPELVKKQREEIQRQTRYGVTSKKRSHRSISISQVDVYKVIMELLQEYNQVLVDAVVGTVGEMFHTSAEKKVRSKIQKVLQTSTSLEVVVANGREWIRRKEG